MKKYISHFFKEGGIWETIDFEIRENHTLSDDDNKCRHVKNSILKAVVVGVNEGGYNSTGICLECILEAAKILKIRT